MIKYENVEKALKILAEAFTTIDANKEITLIDATIATTYMSKLLLKSLEVCNIIPKDKIDLIEKSVVDNLKVEDLKGIIEKYIVKQEVLTKKEEKND